MLKNNYYFSAQKLNSSTKEQKPGHSLHSKSFTDLTEDFFFWKCQINSQNIAFAGDSYEESKPGNDKPKREVSGSHVIPERTPTFGLQ